MQKPDIPQKLNPSTSPPEAASLPLLHVAYDATSFRHRAKVDTLNHTLNHYKFWCLLLVPPKDSAKQNIFYYYLEDGDSQYGIHSWRFVETVPLVAGG